MVGIDPVGGDRMLRGLEHEDAFADETMYPVFQEVLAVEITRWMVVQFRPEVGLRVVATELQGDEVIDLVLARLVARDAVLGVDRDLLLLGHIAHARRVAPPADGRDPDAEGRAGRGYEIVQRLPAFDTEGRDATLGGAGDGQRAEERREERGDEPSPGHLPAEAQRLQDRSGQRHLFRVDLAPHDPFRVRAWALRCRSEIVRKSRCAVQRARDAPSTGHPAPSRSLVWRLRQSESQHAHSAPPRVSLVKTDREPAEGGSPLAQ